MPGGLRFRALASQFTEFSIKGVGEMRTLKRQQGLGWFGLLIMLMLAVFFATLAFHMMPLYLNQMSLARAVKAVAADPGMAEATPHQIERALEHYWDIDDIETVTPKDIAVVATDDGRALSYDYEASSKLFYNISVVIEFSDEVPLRHATNVN